MASGDGLTVALGLRVFNADIELVKTNIPTLMFEILWRGIIGAGALMALLITSKIKRRRKQGKYQIHIVFITDALKRFKLVHLILLGLKGSRLT